MNTPLLSIIIPTYNCDCFIGRCLESVVIQTMTNFEVLIMDGVSKDSTIEIIKSFHDNRIKIYSEIDKGIYDAMNKGINMSQGIWLYFLGSDDYLLNKDVLRTIFFSTNENFDVIYGDVDSNLSKKNQGMWTLETLEYNRCHQAIFYKKTLFEKFGFYNLKYKVGADHDFNLNWFLDSSIKKKYIPLQIAHFNCGGYSSMNGADSFFDDFYGRILKWPNLSLPIELRINYAQKALMKTQNIVKKIYYKFLVLYLRLYRLFIL